MVAWPKSLSATGLAFDLVGAFLLSQDLLRRLRLTTRMRELFLRFSDAGLPPGLSEEMQRAQWKLQVAQAEERAKLSAEEHSSLTRGLWGLYILGLGFLLQLLGTLLS